MSWSGEFFYRVLSMNDVESLESLREELIVKASEVALNWDERMKIYTRVQIITERLLQL